ncbi:MAG: DUF3078 domain-containing protein [Balneolaceae bacterium]|nr:MAG: DUF3078 domain-containing protein [Balneolaceae bacterium]
MKKSIYTISLFIIAGLFAVSAATVQAQAPAPADTADYWDLSWRASFNGSQATFRNWSQGGTNTLSLTSSSVFAGVYKKNRIGYDFNLNLKYGQTKLEGQDMRKSDDQILFRNQLNYFFNDERWSAVLSGSFQSQFAKGYDADNEVVISRFMSPAYITEMLGIAYKPVDFFEAQFGAALKQTIVNDTDLSTFYGLDAGKSFRNEAGLSTFFKLEKEIWTNVFYSGTLETFWNAEKPLGSTDVAFNNEFTARINNYLTTNFQFMMVYNDDITKELQIKQVLSVGLTFTLL